MPSVTKYMYQLIVKDQPDKYKKDTLYRNWVLGIYIISAISIILLIISQFNHMYYNFDTHNFYFRKGWFWISQIPGIIGMAADSVVIFVKRKKLKAYDAESVFVNNRNQFSIDPSQIECDYYKYLENDEEAVKSYQGYYMRQYSWAEFSIGIYERD